MIANQYLGRLGPNTVYMYPQHDEITRWLFAIDFRENELKGVASNLLRPGAMYGVEA